VYGRLAHDNEVVALKAAGVHLYRIIAPAVLLGVLATVVTAALYHTIIPSTQRQLYEQILSDPEEVLYNQLRRDRCLRHPSMPYVLYTRDVQGKRLIDVVVKRRKKKEGPHGAAETAIGFDYIARMPEAQLRVDVAAGTIIIEANRRDVYEKSTSLTQFNPPPYEWPLPDSVSGKEAKLRISALTWDDLPARIAALEAERDDVVHRRDTRKVEVDLLTDQYLRDLGQAELQQYDFQIGIKTRMVRNLQAEVYARPALAVSCLVFALIGCPVGIWANRADYLSTFVICFLPTLVVYYPLLLAGSDMGKNGRLPLGLGCWMADIIMGGVGVLLTWRLLRR
jgi:lipopolysaccharide export system permease protein